jgi:flavorubredoxin
MAATVHEIAPDVYRLCVFVPQFNLQFCHFLIKDEEPLLFHTGMRQMFPELREAVAKVIDPAKLRWISFSHFESDECGALNDWLTIAPKAEALHSMVGALVNLTDFAIRPAKFLEQEQTITTGKYRYRYISTPHLPHGWDAGVLFEETQKTLLCSDLFHQPSECVPLSHSEVLSAARANLVEYQKGPFADYCPYTHRTKVMLDGLAALNPRTLAIMHGSSYAGDCAQALRDLATVFKEVLGPEGERAQPAGA